MNKIILIDGNNLLYRSYFATAYNGNMMRNSKNFPTNALYGLLNMLNKIINEEKPTHIMIAFDKGKTFRHDKYDTYKAGRMETPDDLKLQFKKAYELVEILGITHFEIDNYEADDIIGTFASYIENTKDTTGLIISSDKDLLQLISDKVVVKLLKSSDHIMMTRDKFKEVYSGIEPIRMIDLKALMGDSSDNIPGVRGVGEKTALGLLSKYESLDGVYDNLENVTPKLREKLALDKENAYMSYDLATIYKHVPIEISLENIEYKGINYYKYEKLLTELEFFSLLKKMNQESDVKEDVEFQIIKDLKELKLEEPYSIYLETLGYNYHKDIPLGVSLKDKIGCYYIPFELVKNSEIFNDNKQKYTYDLKKLLVVFEKNNIKIDKKIDDLMLISYLLNKNIKTDIAYLANSYRYVIKFYEKIYGSEITIKMPNNDDYIKQIVLKTRFIYEIYERFYKELESEDLVDLYKNLELPLTYVLSKMELNGFLIDQDYLNQMGEELLKVSQEIENKIYELAGKTFNILSTKQLAEALFVELNIPYPKKIKDKSYSTSKEILDKLKDKYEIVNLILEYRAVSKMRSNYINGVLNEIGDDLKIHTIFNQTLTKTGRLSSERPNLQNIPIRDELGKLVRKAFIPSRKENKIASFDYSQIELRVFAHMAGASDMIKAFQDGVDIHAKTASQIFGLPLEAITKDMRRKAKAVNFGILYGISSFGLSEDLGINIEEAKHFINKYLEAFPGIKDYMNRTIYDAYKFGYVKTLMNRKRVIEEINNKNYIIRQSGERIALNTPVQGTAADILKKAMIEIDEEITRLNLKSKMLVQVHDELVFEVEPDEVEILKDLVERIMTTTYELKVPLEIDYEIGANWYDAK